MVMLKEFFFFLTYPIRCESKLIINFADMLDEGTFLRILLLN